MTPFLSQNINSCLTQWISCFVPCEDSSTGKHKERNNLQCHIYYTGFSARHIMQPLKSFWVEINLFLTHCLILFLWTRKPAAEHMLIPFCFLQPLSEVQEHAVEWLGQFLPLCLVGIMIHLMLSTCMIAGGHLATRLDIMNSVSHFCHKSQSLTYPPQNCFYRRSFHLWHQLAQCAYV